MLLVASPGHLLGQMIGDFFENLFADDLTALATRLGLYCDKHGPRPARGRSKRIVWRDYRGNDHALDYVIEKDGSATQQGVPVAFVELAWRRYTKHSRNKSGEIAGALLPLRATYPSSHFTGAILAGEYTAGGKKQLTSNGITVLHIPFNVLANSFKVKNIDLVYAETAANEDKQNVIAKWESLSVPEIHEIREHLRSSIASEYTAFTEKLEAALIRTVQVIRILLLYGAEVTFSSLGDAIVALQQFDESQPSKLKFAMYEIQVRFTDGDTIEGTFHSKETALSFLSKFV